MKNKLYTFASILGALTLLVTGAGRASAAGSWLTRVSPDGAATLLQANAGKSNFVILDIRTPGEYSEGHIRNSVLLDYHSPSFSNGLAALDKNRTYFIYCRSGNRTGRALVMMEELGFKRVFELHGGIRAWLASGRTLQVN